MNLYVKNQTIYEILQAGECFAAIIDPDSGLFFCGIEVFVDFFFLYRTDYTAIPIAAISK
jgi:hypothetical protein